MNTRLSASIRLLLCAVIIGVCMGSCVSTARADTNSYLYDLDTNGTVEFGGPQAAFLDLGYRVCADFAAGFTPAQIVHAVLHNPGFDFDFAAAAVVVNLARTDLCPPTFRSMEILR